MDHPDCTVSNFMEYSIGLTRVESNEVVGWIQRYTNIILISCHIQFSFNLETVY